MQIYANPSRLVALVANGFANGVANVDFMACTHVIQSKGVALYYCMYLRSISWPKFRLDKYSSATQRLQHVSFLIEMRRMFCKYMRVTFFLNF